MSKSNVRHFPLAAPVRDMLHEKRQARIAVRCPETLKTHLDRRAHSRELTLSKHLLDLAVRDLEGQAKLRQTLSDLAGDLVRAAELARDGIESDHQRVWILQRLTRFQAALLGAA